MIRGKCVVHLLLRCASALAFRCARLDVHALWQRVPYISAGRSLINVHIQQKALKRVWREWNRKEGRFCFQLYRNPCFCISPYNLKACRHVFGDWALYLSATWSVYIPLCEFNWLIFSDFFSDWILLRCPKEIKGFLSKLVWNLIEQEWVEQRPSVLSCAAYLLCVLLQFMNIQSCTGSLSGFQSLSFFRFSSLATALFFPPTQGHKNTEKHT